VEEQNPEEQVSAGQPSQPMKTSDQQKPSRIGQPGIESASGRDRSKGELPATFGTDEGSIDLSEVAPAPGAIEGSRVGTEGDPTGSEDRDEGSRSSAKPESSGQA
jgi:hypothetical protein